VAPLRGTAALPAAGLCLFEARPIESTFATVRHRTKVTRGPGSRAAGLALAFKLIEAAQDHWRMVNAPAPGRTGARRGDFVNGNLVERPGEHAAGEGEPPRTVPEEVAAQAAWRRFRVAGWAQALAPAASAAAASQNSTTAAATDSGSFWA
jgi:hypothetical protein